MAPRSLTTMTATILCITLGLVSLASAANTRRACCIMFTKKPLPLEQIRGFGIITGKENCPIPAVIFYTKLNKAVCARPGEKWVKRLLDQLSAQLKMPSKPTTDASKSKTKMDVSPTVNDGSGSFTNTTTTIPNTTEGYYW